jgi:four helix bundle protein
MLRKEKDIYKRIDKFALQSLFVIKKIPLDLINREILRQLIRSVTSIGANAREAQASQTRKEFVRCLSISKREAKESQYWFFLLTEINPNFKAVLEKLAKECDELTSIISAIISSTKKNAK